ncbi:FecR family protein [Mucilaginibacter terrae]|uniref:Transmembrane sensor n=1 Tax=Mucilaginibacter terrae TaxID=1955052 RepID=A0ABU3H018_9SPHI|nr:FecR domain-containing protein [Mucilaginibacter terrae]MDT3405357.1 transmembrane sensor [Mucilaginibacter terrae]
MKHKESAQVRILLQKYREGSCTPQEAQRIENWLRILDKNSPDVEHNTEEKLLKASRKQVAKSIALPRNVYTIMRPYMRIAAALLLIPLAYILYTKPLPTPVVTRQQFSTVAGERKIIRLPDSTEVVLNASSKLIVSADFNEKKRNVKLSGEAYFRVAHDASKPFIVSTGKLQTRVLGTEFNVHAYDNESNIKVAVVKGRVRVSEKKQTGNAKQLGSILTHNLMLNYNLNNQHYTITTADAEKIASWQNGGLYFEDADIQEIVMALSRRYNCNIELADKPVGKCNYTIGFSREPLSEVLRVLNQLTGITYKSAQNKIIIHAKNCH